MQIQQSEVKQLQNLVALKIIFWIWILAVIFVYLTLFGPPEFWRLAERLRLADEFVRFQTWLRPFFTANYLS